MTEKFENLMNDRTTPLFIIDQYSELPEKFMKKHNDVYGSYTVTCDPEDEFVDEIGQNLAKTRLLAKVRHQKAKYKEFLREEFESMIDRAYKRM